jgi:hypothetical protein
MAKAAEADKKRAEAQASANPATEPNGGKESDKTSETSGTSPANKESSKGQSAIEKELQETSSERPAASSLKSIDDEL